MAWMDGWISWWIGDEWMCWMDDLMNRRMDEQMDRINRINGWLVGWMDGCIDGWSMYLFLHYHVQVEDRNGTAASTE